MTFVPRMLRYSGLLACLATLLIGGTAFRPAALGHGGQRDQFGGHAKADGTYHFHTGPLAEKSFPSKEEAHQALKSLSTPGGQRTVRVCSFNIRIFSNGSRDDAELREIERVLVQYDLIAIQELRDVTVLRRTEALLETDTGTDWRFEVSAAVGHQVKELYAFLYRTDRVLVKNPGQLVKDPNGLFIRPPYYATFRAGNFDFTLLTIHALYKSKNAPERRIEFDALADAFNNVLRSDPHERDLILLGDFNDSPTHERISSIRNIPGITFVIHEPEKTTISDSSLYDNLWFQPNAVKEYTGEAGVDRFDAQFSSKELASKQVSDHRPVWAVFSTEHDDD